MNHIEEEARKKWCPMARIVAVTKRDNMNEIEEDGYGPYNRWEESCSKEYGELPLGSYCIASDCMMWVWKNQDYVTGDYEKDCKLIGWCGLVKR